MKTFAPSHPADGEAPEPVAAGATHRRAVRERPTPRRRGADAYDTLLWRLLPLLEARPDEGRAIGVIGCERGAGVSTVAANLAIRAADHHADPVLLVDGSTHRPRVARSFRLDRGAIGLADVLAGRCELTDAIHSTAVAGLSVMPLGTPGLMDRLGLDPLRMEETLDKLRDMHELVVFDLPEAAELRHMLLAARRVDAAVLVLRSDATRRQIAERTADRLRADGVNLVGSVVTRQRQYVPNWIRRRV